LAGTQQTRPVLPSKPGRSGIRVEYIMLQNRTALFLPQEDRQHAADIRGSILMESLESDTAEASNRVSGPVLKQ
jgi:hypothetical protein